MRGSLCNQQNSVINKIDSFLILVFSCQLQVREIISILDIDVLFYPCPKNGPNFRPKAIEIGGKRQFPYMVRRLPRNIVWHSEWDIVGMCVEVWFNLPNISNGGQIYGAESWYVFQSSPTFRISWLVDVPSGVAWKSEIIAIFKHVYANYLLTGK